MQKFEFCAKPLLLLFLCGIYLTILSVCVQLVPVMKLSRLRQLRKCHILLSDSFGLLISWLYVHTSKKWRFYFVTEKL